MAVTVLVTGAGAMPGIAIINALKGQSEVPVRVVAADMNPLSAGLYLSDRFHLVPAVEDPAFLDAVLEICRREKVEIIFPVIDDELPLFAEHRHEFAAQGIRVISNDAALVRLARDKYETYLACCRQGIPVPATWLAAAVSAADIPGFPVVVKPRRGRGTLNVFVARDERELAFFVRYVPDSIVQEFVPGQEYTIDVLTDFAGQVISVVPKARLETKAGMQVKGRVVKDARLIDYAIGVHRAFNLAPRANVQCIAREGTTALIEINPKFPASLPFTVAAGVNAPLLLVRMARGERVAPMIGEFQDGLTMLRYWRELFLPAEAVGRPPA